mmetsp:Transcript_17354/g.32891  ORF Transcript_17354/g.32891 Transcript_17354/m.32891 type:complete len:500 (+) Transcript_17354:73-1572(+)
MDFAKRLTNHENVTTKSGIKILSCDKEQVIVKDKAENEYKDESDEKRNHIRNLLVQQANKAATDLFLSTGSKICSTIKSISDDATITDKHHLVDCKLYPTKLLSPSSIIEPGSLVVIFESFDSLNFVYAASGEVFYNRNGHFHHDDFIGKPYGCKIRSRNNSGFGFIYLLRPTPELWARSLNHRTQIVHELDSAMIVFHLNLRPNMVVFESGTGSGAMSHCIMRAIAPHGKLHTFEFNQVRAKTARDEFQRNGVGHLVQVHWRDVCGKPTVVAATETEAETAACTGSDSNDKVDEELVFGSGGFDIGPAAADAIFLDLPEPWLAIPHAAHSIKPNGGLCSYSPCVEQTQRTVQAMRDYGFHSLKTIEVRLREHYVDDVELDTVPTTKLPRDLNINTFTNHVAGGGGDPDSGRSSPNDAAADDSSDENGCDTNQTLQQDETIKGDIGTPHDDAITSSSQSHNTRKRKMLCARPFSTMRGHTAFLTFATAGNKTFPDPNTK